MGRNSASIANITPILSHGGARPGPWHSVTIWPTIVLVDAAGLVTAIQYGHEPTGHAHAVGKGSARSVSG